MERPRGKNMWIEHREGAHGEALSCKEIDTGPCSTVLHPNPSSVWLSPVAIS
jgi:hypothetical protein